MSFKDTVTKTFEVLMLHSINIVTCTPNTNTQLHNRNQDCK